MNNTEDIKQTGNLSLSEVLFFIGWGIYLTQAVLTGSTLSIRNGFETVSGIYQYLRYISYLFMALSLLNQMISEGFLKVFAVIMCISVLIAHFAGNTTLVFLFFVILAAYHQDYRKVLKFTFVLHLILFLMIILMSQTGFIPDYVSDLLTRVRHCLGFTWATLPQTYMLFLTMEYICLRDQKINYGELVGLLIPCSVIFELTNARMVYLINVLFIFLAFLFKIRGGSRPVGGFWRKLLICLPVIICIVAISMYFLYSPDKAIWQRIDNALSGRMELGVDALKKYGITLFGNRNLKFRGHSVNTISQDSTLYNYVDCSYLQAILLYGIGGLGTVICLFIYFMQKAVKSDNMYLILSIVCILLLCITEDSLLIIRFNIFLVLIFTKMSENVSDRKRLS